MGFWDKFIANGFERLTEVEKASKEFDKYGASLEPSIDDLFVRWRFIEGTKIKEYVVCCRCGNSKMLVHDKGIRCHICGRFHAHETFAEKSREVRRLAKFNDGKIVIQQQPLQYGRPSKHSQKD